MCGIIGYFGSRPSPRREQLFLGALKSLGHRGPDDQGFERIHTKIGEGFFGHTRLSIIDLSSSGHQPMISACGRYTLIFNGEIYNYRELRDELTKYGAQFKSNSDTEVLLSAWTMWKEKCLTRLTGMFAFAIFDRYEDLLYCARDPFGIKPFYYCINNGEILFSSEIPALIKLSGNDIKPNFQKGYEYLVAGRYDNSEHTFFEGVLQLRPGHLLEINLSSLDNIKISRWWQPSIEKKCSLSFADASDKLRAMFLENIGLHLRSDVPIGVGLSGGLDSSAVVCAIRHIESKIPINTFSFIARDTSVDEEKWVDIINHHVGAVSNKVIVNPSDWVSDLDEMIRAQGEPFGSMSIYAQYCVYRRAKEAGITVILDGQGADELLAGYHGFPVQRMRSLIDSNRYIDAFQFFCAWAQWPSRPKLNTLMQLASPHLPQDLRKITLKTVGRDPIPSWLNGDFIKAEAIQPFLFDEILPENCPRGRHLMSILRESLTSTGLNALLRHGDRNSMKWSIESRLPFLTANMAEFLLSLPENYLISDRGETKSVFRAAMRGIVPDSILDRRDKIGFQSPEFDWLCAGRSAIEKILDQAESVPIINIAACRKLVMKKLNGHKASNSILWRIINYSRWYHLATTSGI